MLHSTTTGLFTRIIIAVALAAGLGGTVVACGSMHAGSIREGGGVHISSPTAFVRAPKGFPGAESAQDQMGREILRCYEAELGDTLNYSDPAMMLQVAMDDGGGLVIRATQGRLSSSGRFNNCITSTATLWDWSEFPRDDEGRILPLEFGMTPPPANTPGNR